MTKRHVLIVGRLFFGVLTLAAISSQLVIQIRSEFSVVNFFSYFTNLSNIFAAVVLLVGAYTLATQRPSQTDDIVRGTAVVCMALVGMVFSTLLRDVDLGSLQPWVNTVTHYVMPIVVVADWLLDPPKSPLPVKQIAYWVIFPATYVAYSIIRGAAMGFYAYPFFNPEKVGGYGGVALYCLGILVAFLFVSWLLLVLGNTLQRAQHSTVRRHAG